MGLHLRPVTADEMVSETDRSPADLQPLARALVRRAREGGGSATFDSARYVPPDAIEGTFPGTMRAFREPFPISQAGDPHHRYVNLSDGHHRIVVERAATAETTEYVLVGRTNPRVNDRAAGVDAVAFDALPRHDRLAVLAFLRGDATEDGGVEFGRVWPLGYLLDGHVSSSLLVPEPAHDYVAYRDWFLAVERQDTRRGTRAVYDVSLERVGDDEGSFAAAIKRTDGVDLEARDPSDDQRAILSAATGDSAWVCLDADATAEGDDIEWVGGEGSARTHDPGAFRALVETIGTARYVKYDGSWYGVRTSRAR